MIDISGLSKKYGVCAERGRGGDFPAFLSAVKGLGVLVLADRNTEKFAAPIVRAMQGNGTVCKVYVYPEFEPVADEKSVNTAKELAEGFDYILAVGSGTLNDIAKYAGMLAGKPSGVYATAPSMDGFTSGVAALIVDGKKVTYPAQVAKHILMDCEVLASAPSIMLGAGVGDILAKYCCLTDWRISAELTGEEYNAESAKLMYEAVNACDASIPDLIAGSPKGAEKLMNALLVSGYAMVIAGNSRPASGAEHHMSHFLEMDFLRRGERIPLHGVKVGLGTMVSLYLYHTILKRATFAGSEFVAAEAEKLPKCEYVEDVLRSLGCPTRFSELGVSEATVREMFKKAYLIRDRFTILSLYCTYGLMTENVVDELIARFY